MDSPWQPMVVASYLSKSQTFISVVAAAPDDEVLGRQGPAKGSVRSGLLDGGIEPVMLHALYR